MSRRRRPAHRNRRPAPPRSTPRTAEAEMARLAMGMVESVRRESRGLAGEDALQAEMVASGLLSMWTADWPDEREALAALGATVLRQLAKTPDADVLALLLAVAALATPPLDAVAREVAASLRTQAVPEPIWSRAVGRPALVDAWISTDELEDQSNLAAVFAYDRQPPHVFVTMVDANFGGLVRQAFVGGDPDKVREEWTAVSGMPIRPLSEQELADRLAQGIEMFDGYLDPPVDAGARQLMPLLRARLRLLPTPRPIEQPETPEEERAELAGTFAASPEASALEAAKRSLAEVLARWFIDFACDYGAGDPLRWSPIAVEILMADWLPRKAILEPDEVAALPDALRAFVRFSARRKGLAEDVFVETLAAVDKFAPEFADGMKDERRAGPAKEIAMGLKAAGIDLSDEAAIQAWIDRRDRELPGG